MKKILPPLFFVLFILVIPVSAKPLPYNITDNGGLEIDGRYYWDNGVPITKSPIIWQWVTNGYNYAVMGDIYKAYFSLDMNKDNAFNFEYDGTNVSFLPKSIYLQSNPTAAIKSQSVTAVVSGNTITYPGMYGQGLDYRLIYTDNLVKEELILAQNPYAGASDSDTFIFKHRFNYSSLTPYVNGAVWAKSSQNTSEPILFKNPSGGTYFEFAKPYAIDANGWKIDLTYDLSNNQQTGEMNIKLNVPMSFLNHASYPIIIDPSLSQNGGSITLDGTHAYDSVSVTNGGIIYVTAYDGTGTTGWLQLNVSGAVNVDSTSQIIGDSRGYRGGGGGGAGTCNVNPATGGSGGEVSGGGSTGDTPSQWCSGAGGGGGGSYGSSGGSGGRGGGSSGWGAGGSVGSTFGTQTGWDISMGAGAGGGGGSASTDAGDSGNPGGAMLIINAQNIYIHGTVSFNGGNGGNGGYAASFYGGGGGGGASGGGILFNSTNIMDLSSSTIRANGGSGGAGQSIGGVSGSSGGGGRIKIFYVNSYTAPATLSAGTTYTASSKTTPPTPINILATKGNNWVNTTWEAGLGNITDSYNVNVNGVWTNGSTDTYYNSTLTSGAWQNVTVYAYNSSGIGTINTTGLTLNTSSNNFSFVFSSKSISETQIYQSSQATTISVSITDSDGTITSVNAGISFNNTETNYTMTNTAGNTWSYTFASGVAGAYTVTNFYATDDLGGTNNSAWSQAFQVVLISGGGGSGGAGSGGGGGGGGGSPAESPDIQAIQNFTSQPITEIASGINIKTIAATETGAWLFNGLLLVGLVMMVLGAVSKKFTRTTMFWGLIFVIFSIYAMGVIS